MQELGKILVFAGIAVAAIGLVLWSGVGRTWIGHLPGDIHVRRGNLSFHFPIATCLLLSVLVTVILALFRRR